jgi:hypothetical protein
MQLELIKMEINETYLKELSLNILFIKQSEAVTEKKIW